MAEQPVHDSSAGVSSSPISLFVREQSPSAPAFTPIADPEVTQLRWFSRRLPSICRTGSIAATGTTVTTEHVVAATLLEHEFPSSNLLYVLKTGFNFFALGTYIKAPVFH